LKELSPQERNSKTWIVLDSTLGYMFENMEVDKFGSAVLWGENGKDINLTMPWCS